MTLPITWIGSCNKTPGRGGFRPEAIVIHIMEGTLGGTDDWFNNPASKVSAHYGIGRNGQVHQYVPLFREPPSPGNTPGDLFGGANRSITGKTKI
jgi:hypothetical protein